MCGSMKESIEATCAVSSPPHVLSESIESPRPCTATPSAALLGTRTVKRITRPPASSAASSKLRTTLRLPELMGWRGSSWPPATRAGVTSAACSTRLVVCGHKGEDSFKTLTFASPSPRAVVMRLTSLGSAAALIGWRRRVRSPTWWAPGWSRWPRGGNAFHSGGTKEKLPGVANPSVWIAPVPQRRPTCKPPRRSKVAHGAGAGGSSRTFSSGERAMGGGGSSAASRQTPARWRPSRSDER